MSAPTLFRPLAEIEAWQENYNKGDVDAIARSIQSFGFNGRLATHGDTVMAGNHALAALRQLQEAGAPFPGGRGLTLEGDMWAVLVTPLDHLSRRQAEAFAVADNRTRDLATADDELLARLLEQIAAEDVDMLAATGYDAGDLDRLLASLDDGSRLDVDAEPQIERADELREKWGTETGQMWILGEHRLLCGDSTNPADVQRLMNGERSRLFATDPPYLVDYDGTNHPGKAGQSKKRTAVQNKDWSDTYKDWDDSSQGIELYQGFVREALAHAITEDAAWYCWHASRRQAMLEQVWEEFGAFVHQQIIWAKDRGILTRSWYLWQHEPCFFGWVRGQKPLRAAKDYPGTVWSISTSAAGKDTGHPTSKPVELFEIPMLQHTLRGDVCYEPFSGSGSQIIAGERTGRRVYAMEKAPAFVAVQLERYLEATGKTPILEGTWQAPEE